MAICIYFAILAVYPAPFCILDEIEAALDDANISYFADYLKEFSKDTQFIVVTHRKGTMERCDSLYGVAMEVKGVGRPSTYAATVSTIEDREYVVKQDKRLAPTPLGEIVTGLMVERFSDIIDVEFPANMESRLDDVETGKQNWKD